MPSSPQEVLDFWFGSEDDPDYGTFRSAWFTKNEDFDNEVRKRFADTYEMAATGELDGWREEAGSCLALIIVLDQFSRNMFRGDGRTHAADGKALETARYAVENALDRELPMFQRHFVYMPYMHSEDIEVQRRSEALFERLREDGGPNLIEYAVGHREIVERFGRFPHRNSILDRETTSEEVEFLKGPGSSF